MLLSIDPISSPRIITVLAPDTDITIQDLVNLLRDWEDNQENLEYDKLIDASGKQDLGGGVKVGVTCSLVNAKLAFEARPGPAYAQCSITGGNFVALDNLGNPMSPIQPTAFTQVVLTSSSSATLQELKDVQYASFNEGVYIDVVNGVAGTAYPCGNSSKPVNNLANALTIAVSYGFKRLYVFGNLIIGATESVNNYEIVGRGEQYNTVTLTSGCTTSGAIFRDLTVSGRQSGETHYLGCEIGELFNTHCFFEDCRIIGPLHFSTTVPDTTVFRNCYGSDVNSLPTVLDMNNSPTNLSFNSFAGNIQIQNLNKLVGAPFIAINMVAGKIIIDSTCTRGSISIQGTTEIEDNSSGSAINSLEAMNATNLNTLLLDTPIDGIYSLQQILRVMLAAIAGKVSGNPLHPVFRNLSDTSNVLQGDVDANGNRSNVTVNV